MNFVVRARKTTRAAHAKNIAASFEVDIVADNKTVARLSDGIVRIGEKGLWISPPTHRTQGENAKWLKYWRAYPDDRETQEQWQKWVLEEIRKQIPDLGTPPTEAQEIEQRNRRSAANAAAEPATANAGSKPSFGTRPASSYTAPTKPAGSAPRFGGSPVE